MAQESNVKCPQNCRMCSMQQRSYCSSQMSLYMLGTIRDIAEEMKSIKADLEEVKKSYINNDEGFIEIAQEGSGAETIDSQENQLLTT